MKIPTLLVLSSGWFTYWIAVEVSGISSHTRIDGNENLSTLPKLPEITFVQNPLIISLIWFYSYFIYEYLT